PALSGLAATTISENGVTILTGTITDPGTLDTFTLNMNWGDPPSPNNLETYPFAASATGSKSEPLTHQYLDDRPPERYHIQLNVTKDHGAFGVSIFHDTTIFRAPALSGLAATTISENGVTTLTGTITDPGTLDTFTLTVNWGDPLSPNNVEHYPFAA